MGTDRYEEALDRLISHIRTHYTHPNESKLQDGTQIEKNKFISITPAKRSLAFVDGGNAPLFETALFSIHYVRLAGILPDQVIREEFYSVVSLTDNKYSVMLFPENEICLHNDDLNQPHVKASDIHELIRRIGELKMCAKISKSADIVVLDGSLEPATRTEEEHIQEMPDNIIGLSKTTSIGLTNGHMIGPALKRATQLPTWYYPVESTQEYKTGIIKLNQEANHTFRIDTKKNPHEYSAALMHNAKDPVFPGYPYGLVLADQHARISNQEQELLKTRFLVKTGSLWKDLHEELRSADAHDILDSIQ